MDPHLELTFIGTATTLLRWRPDGAAGDGAAGDGAAGDGAARDGAAGDGAAGEGAGGDGGRGEDDLVLLTDPNFLHRGQFAYLGKGLVSRRLTEPALTLPQLPALDGVVLSHLHGDHFDRVARRGLDRAVPLVTTPHARRRLSGRHGFTDVRGLGTWEASTITAGRSQVRVTAAPARHARRPWDALLPPVMGSLLEFGAVGGPPALTVYVSGDTLLVPELSEIPVRYPEVDLAVVHLGGTTLPGGLVVTLDGAGGAGLVELVRPHETVPVHVDDYAVFRSPLVDFLSEVRGRRLGGVRVVARGETAVFPTR